MLLPLFLYEICDSEQVEDLSAFYEKYHDKLLRYAKSLLGNRGTGIDYDAEDVVQDAFYRVLKRRLLDFSRGEQAVWSFIRQAVEWSAKDFLNRRKVFYTLEEYGEYAISDEDFFAAIRIKEQYDTVVKVLEGMDSIYSYTLYLKVDGRKPKEIARYMEIPVDTVYTRIRRGQKILMDRLKELGEDEDF